jgi:uncharacterized membrane protein
VTLDSAIALAALALAAFGLRASGILLGGFIPSTGKTGQFLREMPGTVMISLVAPIVASGGPAEWLATAATAVAAKVTGNLMWSIAAGLGTVWALRQLL